MADGAHETETAILDAALAEVLAHGIRRTTASDIARRCGIARQTLYRYWPDAQAIFAALVTRELVAALPTDAAHAADLAGMVELLVETADRIRRMPLVDRLRDTDPELFARYILDQKPGAKIAVPNVPPIERKKVADEVATPMSRGSTEFCIASTSTCMTRPIPAPRTTMYTAVCQYGVSDPSVDSSQSAIDVSAVPTIGNRL